MSILDRFSLEGRIALVTAGAGPLFGSSLSEGLCEAGATVITASRNLEANESYAASLREQGYDAYGFRCDIADTGSIDELHQRVPCFIGSPRMVETAHAFLRKYEN